VTGFSSKNDRSYPLQRDLFLSLAAALVAVHEIKVKTGRFHPLTSFWCVSLVLGPTHRFYHKVLFSQLHVPQKPSEAPRSGFAISSLAE